MAAIPPGANLAMSGGDPRLSDNGEGIAEFSRTYLKKMYDSSVQYEEYLYFAKLSREEERGLAPAKHPMRILAGFGRKKEDQRRQSVNMPSTEIDEKKEVGEAGAAAAVSDEEWARAARAGRTATWGTIFYLITTDILGPTNAPYAIMSMGWGPGIALYAIFGACAAYGGYLLWRMFLDCDSIQYPVKTFGDLGFRQFGQVMRHFFSGLQAIQLIFNVGLIMVGQGQGIVQINPKICFIGAVAIWLAAGMLLGQIRTLQRFGWIANAAIWLNVTVIIITMVCVAHEPPNYSAAAATFGIPAGKYSYPPGTGHGPPPPIYHYSSSPPGSFIPQVNGLFNAVFAYGGAMIFLEFMSEMRKPFDFWKGMLLAQSFIFVCYVFFGVWVYNFQGQYTYNPANQGISSYAPQTAGNVIGLISGIIAAALYGNIGIKVIYQNIGKDLLGGPDLTSTKGKILWVIMIPVFWGFSFVIGAGIPAFTDLIAFVGALCIFQFSYTFPPMMIIQHNCLKDAIQEGEGYDPATRRVIRHDGGFKRWWRGYKKQLIFNTLNFIYFLGCLTTFLLGMYTSISGLIQATSGKTAVTSFSCKSPLG